MDPHPWLIVLTLALTACAALWDLRTGLIPNWLVGGGLLLGAVLRLVTAAVPGGVASDLLAGMLGLLMCAFIPLVLYVAKGLGGGDVKLLAACGFCLGPWAGFELQLYAFGCTSLYAFAKLAYQGALFRTLTASAALLANPILPAPLKRPVPQAASTTIRFGPGIFVGALLACLANWRLA